MKCNECNFEAKTERGLKVHAGSHRRAAEAAPEQPKAQEPEVQSAANEPKAAKAAEAPSGESLLLKRLAELEARDAENQKMIKMLYDVADKGRVFSWESKQSGTSGQGQKVKLAVIDDKILVGWRTTRDELLHDPRTGNISGEFQQYELLLYGKDGQHSTKVVDGYKTFSDLRYENRIECQILGKTESFDGKLTFEVGLPDGNKIQLDGRFLN